MGTKGKPIKRMACNPYYTKAGKRVGRPSKYKNPDELIEKMLKLGAQGKSKDQIAAALGIAYNTFDDWQNPGSPRYQPEFSHAVIESQRLAKGWFEEQAQGGLFNRNTNAAMFKFLMQNRFRKDYSEGVERNSETKDVNINISYGEATPPKEQI